jgi:hypothetical protein
VRDCDQQRNRRDQEDQHRNEKAGDTYEDQNRLSLARHDVDIAERLRDPDDRSQTDQYDQERTQRGAKNISTDRPHPQHRPLIRRKPDRALGFPAERDRF